MIRMIAAARLASRRRRQMDRPPVSRNASNLRSHGKAKIRAGTRGEIAEKWIEERHSAKTKS
jgi:hypothetical protein